MKDSLRRQKLDLGQLLVLEVEVMREDLMSAQDGQLGQPLELLADLL